VNGLRIYDRADPPKQLVWVIGGIHNFFSSVWQWQDEVPAAPPVSQTQHQLIAKGYCNLFLQAHLHGAAGATAYFSGERQLASLGAVELHHALQLPGALVVDDFEDVPTDKTRNTLLQPVTTTALAGFEEEALNTRDAACAASLPSWFQGTHGLVVEWSAASGTYMTKLGGVDVRDKAVLAFRVGQDATGNPPGLPQDFKVSLSDGARSATIRVGAITTIPPPRAKSFIRQGLPRLPPLCAPVVVSLTICWLKTVRLPLGRFKAANPALDLGALDSITFEFGTTPAGRLGIDNLEFSA
jgi:hypothetical protein